MKIQCKIKTAFQIIGKEELIKYGAGTTTQPYGNDKIGFIAHTTDHEKFQMGIRFKFKK